MLSVLPERAATEVTEAMATMLAMHFLRQLNLESLEGLVYIGNDLLAGVFGLLLVCLIISMYESNQNAAESADKEDNDLVSIFLNSQKLDDASLIRKEVQIYTETLLNQQWPAMVLGDLTTA